MTLTFPHRSTLALFVAGLIAPAAATAALPQDEGDATAGANVFKTCKSCHQVGEGEKNGIGPELNNLMGRQIGSVAGFKSSKALSSTDEVWDAATLGAFLANPKAARVEDDLCRFDVQDRHRGCSGLSGQRLGVLSAVGPAALDTL